MELRCLFTFLRRQNDYCNTNLKSSNEGPGISTSFIQNNNGYKVNLYYDWRGNNDYYHRIVFIKNDNTSDYISGDFQFYEIMDYLDQEIEKQLVREAKAKKRKEFLESLTPEQRELLNM